MNGKWVDIINTDAEGRLILGDAMTYAEQLGATHIVDVATLTGAVGRAFGNIVTGAFATPDPWWDDLAAAADRAGERYWRIPLIKDYMSEMESWYGDIQNTGTPDGSLVKSGLFLEQFRTVPWAHLDIGGTGYFRKTYPYAPAGRDGRDPRDAGRARARGCRAGLTVGGPRGSERRARRLRPVADVALAEPARRRSSPPSAASGASSPTASRPAGRSTRTAASARSTGARRWSWSRACWCSAR